MKKVMTPEFRVSFPNVFEPKAFQNQEPKYSIVMLFDKKQDLTVLKNLIKEKTEEVWPKDKRPKNLRLPLKDGDIDNPEYFAGYYYCAASSKSKPGIVDEDCNPIINKEEFYAGCYARATITCFPYDVSGNRGVSFGLQNIQKLREGEPFSGKTKAEDDFEPVTSKEEDDDFPFGN